MSSRLDRLFVLLESGSSSTTRKTAANQLGEVVRVHPGELHNLLNRIHHLLRSSSWDTRIAASNAVEAIVKNLPHWNVRCVSDAKQHENTVQEIDNEFSSPLLKFSAFDIDEILTNTIYLTANTMEAFNLPNVSDAETKEMCVKQINTIASCFGGPSGDQDILNISEIISPDDITSSLRDSLHSGRTSNNNKRSIGEVLNLSKSVSGSLDESYQRTKRTLDGTKRIKLDNQTEFVDSMDEISEWPLESFAMNLKDDLFSPKWEIRHGSATALREIMRINGKNAGLTTSMKKSQMEECHQRWLEDLSVRLICVLALDRFGDYVSDQVVAPVRETCAQCLGSVLYLMHEDRVHLVIDSLIHLLSAGDWDARHGGLLGLKYLLATRQDIINRTLPRVFNSILSKLTDPVDDVRAAAARCLLPVCKNIVDSLSESVSPLINQLYNLLLEEDDLGSTCNHIMDLLGSLFEIPDTKSLLNSSCPVLKVMPRLWPFLSHNSSSVRRASLQTLFTLISLSHASLGQESVLLKQTLRHIFYRALLENNSEILKLVEHVWYNITAKSPADVLLSICRTYFQMWLYMIMQPVNVPFDNNIFTQESDDDVFDVIDSSSIGYVDVKLYLGGDDTLPSTVRDENAVRVRCVASRMLGVLAYNVMKVGSTSDITDFTLFHLNSKSSIQRIVSSLVITECFRLWKTEFSLDDLMPIQSRLIDCLSEIVYFDEIGCNYTKLLQETGEYISLLRNQNIPIQMSLKHQILSLEEILELTDKQKEELFADKLSNKSLIDDFKEKRINIQASASKIRIEQSALTVTTMAAIAGAVMMTERLPEKITLVIKPLMESIKKDNKEMFQEMSSCHLARLVDLCVERNPSPNGKIISNLSAYLSSDLDYTILKCPGKDEKYVGIVSLFKQQKASERCCRVKRNTSSNFIDVTEDQINPNVQSQIQKRGAIFAFTKIVDMQGKNLPRRVPDIWNIIYEDIKSSLYSIDYDTDLLKNDEPATKLISNLHVLEIVSPCIHSEILPQITDLLCGLYCLLIHPYYGVRHMASRCIGIFAKLDVNSCMYMVINHVLPLLESSDICGRQGAIEAISIISEQLELNILPYIVVLIVPLLGRMSDQDESVRLLATNCFGSLVQLIPLDGILPHPPDLPSELSTIIDRQRSFLAQLLNPKLIKDYVVPVFIKTELRSYQQCGVNWLAFLYKYKLHGILCDDMGLGKTLQSLCILASAHHDSIHANKEKKTRPKLERSASLVICPPTLISHWVYEIQKFIPRSCLRPLQYEGVPGEREKLRTKVGKYNVIVASYDIIRKDVDFFSKTQWHYCILDEGHIIKNGKTKIAKSIKQVHANHRLILSGTPIQNNVLELWSLFDFLMPGFLGTEKQFNMKYSKPILISRDPKCSAKEQEAGILAMESLHHQVLPFILRRMKEDVLKDLPPKITQDYYCDLSIVQQLLYEDFSRTEAAQMITSGSVKYQNKFSVFQALRYLQSVCNHPKLVLTPTHPQFAKIQHKLQEDGTDLNDIKHAAKLPALKQLLLDCGIGISGELSCDSIVSQHRALIFCQLKSMLNIIETDLFKAHMPSVTYLRMDGGVQASERQSIVNRFNNDPSIDVLILTTHVGGLGLNLTGADTVIFVEHDWSPMKDLQAMDRAHRIGQKKVVNVYRLITRSTLEEKIMGLQKFKLFTATSVINAQNSTLSTMSTDKMLDLFTLNKCTNESSVDNGQQSTSSAIKSNRYNAIGDIFRSLPDLWDNKEYEEEYDLSSFVQNLKNS